MKCFCWVLIALTRLSGATRLAAFGRQPPDERLSLRGSAYVDWLQMPIRRGFQLQSALIAS